MLAGSIKVVGADLLSEEMRSQRSTEENQGGGWDEGHMEGTWHVDLQLSCDAVMTALFHLVPCRTIFHLEKSVFQAAANHR